MAQPTNARCVILLILASLGFAFYIRNFADYAATYGNLGAIIILMMWLYIAGLVILVGSEITVVIESQSGRETKFEKI